MKLSMKWVIALLASVMFHAAQAQEVESAPQEPPYVQENEFESSSDLSADDMAIEAEMNQSLDPVPAPKKETVNLNESVGDAAVVPAEPEDTAFDFETSEDPTPVPQREDPKYAAPAKLTPRKEGKVGSKAGGVHYIHHPQASKGLLRITEDGAYIYKTEDIKSQGKSGTLRFGMMDPPKIVSADGSTTFESMYSASQQPLLMFDYEWQPFSSFGKLGVQAGFGFLMSTGKGRFISGSMAGQEAEESYTFAAIPLNLGLIYRMEWMRRQWVAPYVSAGGSYVGVVEFRDDSKAPSAVGTPGAYGAGGLLFNISAIDKKTAFTMANEYGITNLWVTLEYRYLYTFSEEVDLTSGIISAGVAVDY